jgi:hypothetical protein
MDINLANYIIRTIVNKRDDIMWAIDLMFSGAANILTALQDLGDEFTVEDIQAIVFNIVEDDGSYRTNPAGANLINMLTEQWEEKQAEKAARKDERSARKLANRGGYVSKSDIEVSYRKSDGGCKYRYNQGLDAPGLMEEYLRHIGCSPTEPVVMNVLNRLPKIKDTKGRDTSQQHDVPKSEADLFWDHGYMFCGGKTLWNRNIPELWAVMHALFPKAIGFSSYHRGLRAPLVPGGFLADLRVRTHNVQLQGALQGADGSGLYDPAHPDMADLVERYGAVAFQFRAFEASTGKFWKGIIVPRENINNALPAEEQAAIHFDHLQIKGSKKAVHKAMHKMPGDASVMDDGVYIGIMKAKTSMGKVSSCFETLENIGPDPLQYDGGKNSPEYLADLTDTAKTLRELTEETCNKLGEEGPDGLLGRACRDDQYLRRLGEFITMANEQGAGINPLDVPILASKVEMSLSRTLWNPSNGAGMNGRYPMTVIDDTLEPGTVVLSGYKPGEEIACWRFPTILAQGLRVLKVVRGRDHHKVDGKLTPNIIWMNSFDITVCQQGDDDGDEVGVSNDPRIIKLFKRRKDNRIFLIEPEGKKLDHATDSEEGRKYIGGDPMGPVGKVTIWKAALAAVGADDYELAFAVLIQEAIDSQKNLVLMTDVHKAADINNWWQDPETGWYYIHKEGKTDNHVPGEAGEFDIDMVKEAFDQQMIANGCIKVFKKQGRSVIKAGWPLGWRTQHRLQEGEGGNVEVKLRKAIAVDNWKSWREKQDTPKSNWVHMCHDVAMNCWKTWHESFKSKKEVPTKEVLLRVLNNLGYPLQPLQISWDEYMNGSKATTYASDWDMEGNYRKQKTTGVQGLRVKSGLVKYGKEMQKLRSAQTQKDGAANTAPLDEQARLSRIDALRQELDICMSALSAQELLTIWCMELTPCWWYKNAGRVYVTDRSLVPQGVRSWSVNRPNYAFAAVTSKHSAIMRLLGFTTTEACNWLQDETRVNRLISWSRKQDNPYWAITQLIRGNKLHAKECHDDTGAPIHLGDCKECTDRLKTALVRSIRSDRTAQEELACKALISSMNSQVHEALPGVELSEENDEYDDGGYEFFEPMQEEGY